MKFLFSLVGCLSLFLSSSAQKASIQISIKLDARFASRPVLLKEYDFAKAEYGGAKKIGVLNESGILSLTEFVEAPTLFKLSVDSGKTFATFGTGSDNNVLVELKNEKPTFSGTQARNEILQLSSGSGKLEETYFGELKTKMMSAMQKGNTDSANYYLNLANDKMQYFKADLESMVDKAMTDMAIFYALENVLDPNKNRSFYLKKASVLINKYPSSKLSGYLKQRVGLLSGTDIGAYPPAINLNDKTGKAVNLNDYKGKYVLIDFWASWCLACRQQHPSLAKLYTEISREKFDIVSISMDNDMGSWNKAIEKDGLIWKQAIDPSQEVSNRYGVSSLPQNFLLNKEGKIVLKNIHVNELRDFLLKN